MLQSIHVSFLLIGYSERCSSPSLSLSLPQTILLSIFCLVFNLSMSFSQCRCDSGIQGIVSILLSVFETEKYQIPGSTSLPLVDAGIILVFPVVL